MSGYLAKDKGHYGKVIDETADDYSSHLNNQTDINWRSAIAAFRWNHVINKKFFSNVILSYSNYNFKSSNYDHTILRSARDTLTSYTSYYTNSKITDWSAKVDFDLFPNPKHYIRFGLNAIAHSFAPNTVAVRESSESDSRVISELIKGEEYTAYIEDEIELLQPVKLNLGVHASAFVVNGTTYTSVQPRVSSRFKVNGQLSIKASYSEMTQYLHLLTQPSIGLPTDFWVPATENVAPQNSQQVSLGGFYFDAMKNLEFSVEGYYKTMDNLIEYVQGTSFLDQSTGWQEKVTDGIGESYGAEFFVKKNFGKTDGWIGYTLSWSNRTFEELNFGNPFPYKFDRRHDVKIVLNHQLNQKVFFSANWVFASGNAITLPQASYHYPEGPIMDAPGNTALYYTGKNEYRMRPYHRLDVSVRFYKKKKWGERNWVVSIYNAYNRLNPFYIRQESPINWELFHSDPYRFKEIVLFPIMPSVSYQFNF